MAETEAPVEEESFDDTERAKVESWRLECFLGQGWSVSRADKLVLLGVDHHETEHLLALGRDFAWVFRYVT